jgi:hypothetical protein
MKKTIILLTVLIATCTIVFSQKGPLKGSGKTVIQTFELNNFDKINLLDLDGKMEVEVGKPFAITATIDDNLAQLLEATVENGTLTVRLKGNLYNKLYIEETNINIKISLPMITAIKHRSNAKLTVHGIKGNFFQLKNMGNGSADIDGEVDELQIICTDNGNVYAENIVAKILTASRSGNGNIYTKEKAGISKDE